MRFEVDLVARNIEVTATSRREADSYAKEDAIQFAATWDYVAAGVRPVTDDNPLTAHIGDPRPRLECTESKGRGERPFRYDAIYPVIVEADDGDAARTAALRLAYAERPDALAALDQEQDDFSASLDAPSF